MYRWRHFKNEGVKYLGYEDILIDIDWHKRKQEEFPGYKLFLWGNKEITNLWEFGNSDGNMYAMVEWELIL